MTATVPDTPADLRHRARTGEFTAPTAGLFPGIQQVNLVVVPQAHADEFGEFCARNSQACPLVARSAPGDPRIVIGDTTVDVRSDLPRYRVWLRGLHHADRLDLHEHWRDDSVAFLLGCSHTFEGPLERAGVPVRRSPHSPAPAVYITDQPTHATDRIRGPLVVSMRAVPAEQVSTAREVTVRYPLGHGAPVYVGDPAGLGIADLARPDFGPVPVIEPGDVPMFWACGVTPQLCLPDSGADYLFTHAAGHMLVLDHTVDEMAATLEGGPS